MAAPREYVEGKLSILKRGLEEEVEKFSKKYRKNRNIVLSNQAISAVTLGTGATAITSEVTVVGLSVTIVTGAISSLYAITSIALTAVSKSYVKSLLKRGSRIRDLRETINRIEVVYGKSEVGLINGKDVERVRSMVDEFNNDEMAQKTELLRGFVE